MASASLNNKTDQCFALSRMLELWRRNSVRSNRSFVLDSSMFNFNKLVMLVKCSQLLMCF